jgi:hypothetical protein
MHVCHAPNKEHGTAAVNGLVERSVVKVRIMIWAYGKLNYSAGDPVAYPRVNRAVEMLDLATLRGAWRITLSTSHRRLVSANPTDLLFQVRGRIFTQVSPLARILGPLHNPFRPFFENDDYSGGVRSYWCCWLTYIECPPRE